MGQNTRVEYVMNNGSGAVAAKIRAVIQQERTKSPSTAMAAVLKTYSEDYTCDIMLIENNAANTGSVATRVPLPMVGGMSYSLPHIGDKVAIAYIGNNKNFPMIIAVYPTTKSQVQNHSEITSSTLQHFSSIE